jgi:hypothetical protein
MVVPKMAKTTGQTNKTLVLEAFDTLVNKREHKAAERLWSPNNIQHSAHIKLGRDGLFDLIRNPLATLRYEPGTHCCRRRLRDCPRLIHEQLDRRRCRPRSRRPARRTLGRLAG